MLKTDKFDYFTQIFLKNEIFKKVCMIRPFF